MRRLPPLLAAIAATVASAPAAPAQTRETAAVWLEALQGEIAADVAAGRPLVVQVHVPLCDNDIIRCGNPRLGDGDDPDRNLYWATSGGFRGWFGRRGSGWTQVLRAGREGDILETRVWRRRFAARGALRRAGARRSFDVYVVAHAWRGAAIRKAMDAYVRDLFGGDVRRVAVPGPGGKSIELGAGGAARVVAYVGHNGWMDVAGYDFAAVARRATRRSRHKKGTIAVACITEDYLEPVPAATRVPLLMTRTLLFAGAHSFEGAVRALAEGRDFAGIRRTAIQAYATGQGKPAARVAGGFTNPADRRWKGNRKRRR
jgi:hypothetical protein